MAVGGKAAVFDEALALRIVECIALADQRGLTLTATHLVSALASLEAKSAARVSPAPGTGQHLH